MDVEEKRKMIINSEKISKNLNEADIAIGENSIDSLNVAIRALEKIENIVKDLNENLPNAKIYLESIYPINNTNDKKINKPLIGKRDNKRVVEINDKLEKYCNNKNCTYLDIYSLLKDKDGDLKLEYAADGLHVSSEGYEVITKELKKYMHK